MAVLQICSAPVMVITIDCRPLDTLRPPPPSCRGLPGCYATTTAAVPGGREMYMQIPSWAKSIDGWWRGCWWLEVLLLLLQLLTRLVEQTAVPGCQPHAIPCQRSNSEIVPSVSRVAVFYRRFSFIPSHVNKLEVDIAIFPC